MNTADRTSLPRPPWLRAVAMLADESGATAIEYGLICALITLAIIGSIINLGGSIADLPLQALIDAFTNALS